jgi:homoserine dehydrogenase
MALDKDSLASSIKSKLEALKPGASASVDIDYMTTIAEAIIDHFKNSAVITTTITGTVTSGPGAGGAVTGTGTGTIA